MENSLARFSMPRCLCNRTVALMDANASGVHCKPFARAFDQRYQAETCTITKVWDKHPNYLKQIRLSDIYVQAKHYIEGSFWLAKPFGMGRP